MILKYKIAWLFKTRSKHYASRESCEFPFSSGIMRVFLYFLHAKDHLNF